MVPVNPPWEPECGLASGVCPHCAGVRLIASAGESRCVRCGGVWATARVLPCPWPAIIVLDRGDRAMRVCASHAALSNVWELAGQSVRPPG